MANELASGNDLPTWEIEQPRTYRIFRFVVEELVPPPAHPPYNQGIQAQMLGCQHKWRQATIDDLVNYALSLPPELRARLKAVL